MKKALAILFLLVAVGSFADEFDHAAWWLEMDELTKHAFIWGWYQGFITLREAVMQTTPDKWNELDPKIWPDPYVEPKAMIPLVDRFYKNPKNKHELVGHACFMAVVTINRMK